MCLQFLRKHAALNFCVDSIDDIIHSQKLKKGSHLPLTGMDIFRLARIVCTRLRTITLKSTEENELLFRVCFPFCSGVTVSLLTSHM